MIKLKDSIGCVLFGLLFVMLASERRCPSRVAVPVSESTCPPIITRFPGVTPMHSGERSAPSLAAIARRESIRDILAVPSNTVYGDFGYRMPTEETTKNSLDPRQVLMPQSLLPTDAVPFPTTCPVEP